jgi:hypothetical protein
MCAVCVVATATDLARNVVEVAPAGTVTVAGTVTFALSDATVNAIPPVGAAVLMVIVPVALSPTAPTTAAVLRVNVNEAAALIVNVAV